MYNSVLEAPFVKGYVKMANEGYERGWHERNGGNLTYRMTKEEVEACKDSFTYDRPWVPMGVTAENLAGEFFIATGSGKYFRNVILAPEENICIAYVNGIKYTDEAMVMKEMQQTFCMMRNTAEEYSIEEQLNDMFNTINSF